MARYIASNKAQEITKDLLDGIPATPAGRFLREELERYVPLFAGKTPQQIRAFSTYQQHVYLNGKTPMLGKPLASLNPHYTDSVDSLRLGADIYTRVSVKENGYRLQLHNGPAVKAFTRQFVPYDLRMFPELHDIFDELPVMIGDAELVNRKHQHLAGFHRVRLRLPNSAYWPKKGDRIDGKLLRSYLADPQLFCDGTPLPDLELTLAFHGMYAISDPDSWHLPRETQAKTLGSLCNLPIDQRRVGLMLDKLEDHLQRCGLSARVAKRTVVTTPGELAQFKSDVDAAGLEGMCVVQSAADDCAYGRMYKFKRYETLDTALLGLYLADKTKRPTQSNIRAALLGLYDAGLQRYLPCVKVNLDSRGVQVKTGGQKERLDSLRKEIAGAVKETKEPIATLRDVYSGWLPFDKTFAKTITMSSKKLKKPDLAVSTTPPIIVETAVFDIHRGLCGYAAGFDGDSCYVFNNAYPECLRHDKSTTTDYATIDEIAKRNAAP